MLAHGIPADKRRSSITRESYLTRSARKTDSAKKPPVPLHSSAQKSNEKARPVTAQELSAHFNGEVSPPKTGRVTLNIFKKTAKQLDGDYFTPQPAEIDLSPTAQNSVFMSARGPRDLVSPVKNTVRSKVGQNPTVRAASMHRSTASPYMQSSAILKSR